MNICICDDELPVAENLKEVIESIASEKGMEINIKTVTSGKELLESTDDDDAVFLDIEMPNEDGIEIGRSLMEKNSDIIIIMATGHSEKIRESIHIGVKDFITKPYKEEDVRISLDIIKKKTIGKRQLQVYNSRNLYTIMEKDIEKITAYNGYVCIQALDNVFRKETSLKNMMNELDLSLFFQTDRKTVISFLAVTGYEKGIIDLNGEKIKVARDRKKSFEKSYMEYDLYNKR